MRELLEDCVVRVYRFALRLTRDVHIAQDITQETCLRAWRQKGRLRKPGAARVWLFRIAMNVWRDHMRRVRRRDTRTRELSEGMNFGGKSAEETLEDRDEVLRAIRIMDSLPVRQRQVLYLRVFEELTNQEIARILDISEGTVKTSLSLARRSMRERIFGLNSEEHIESDEPTPTPV